MGRPEIIGYKEIYDAPPGSSLVGYASAPTLIGRKPMYKPRPFRAWPAFGGYRVLCKRCETITLTGNIFPHDTASRHKCLYTPETNDKE